MYIGSFKEFQNTLNDIANSLAEAGISLDGCELCSYADHCTGAYDFCIIKNDIKIADFDCTGCFRTI